MYKDILNDKLRKTVWEEKYKADSDNTPLDTFKRVASVIGQTPEEEEDFFNIMRSFEFCPGGRILAGAGSTENVTLSNCYVIPIKDDTVEAIWKAASDCAVTYREGGGCGVNLSALRPSGAKVNNSAKVSSGAASFMSLFDTTTSVIGAKHRRGALLLCLHCQHPDVFEFIKIKDDVTKTSITNANISVLMSDEMMVAIENDYEIDLWYPERTLDTPTKYKEVPFLEECYSHPDKYFKVKGKFYKRTVYQKIKAVKLWEELTLRAHSSAEPGVLFIDTIKEDNPDEERTPILALNPCSEVCLTAYGACVLGSINISKFVKNKFTNPVFDYEHFADVVKLGVRFLDNTLDITKHPLVEQDREMQSGRRIGLGLMGIADALVYMKIPYGSSDSFNFIEQIGEIFEYSAYSSSHELAKEKGAYPSFDKDFSISGHLAKVITSGKLELEEVEKFGMRNIAVGSIAPTGSISLLFGCSSGIEPIFQLEYTRNSDSLSTKSFLVRHGSWDEYVEQFKTTKEPIYFKTAYQISPENKVEFQSILQQYICNAISVTTNLPSTATIKDISDVYFNAWERGCKGITVYREGSRTAILENNSNSLTRESHEVLEGRTIVIPSKNGKIYLTCNVHPVTGAPLEVFLSSSKSGTETKAIFEGFGRLISLILQNGGNLESVISTLWEIKGDATDFSGGVITHSLPDAIAKGLLKVSSSDVFIKIKCEECGGEIIMTGGCSICQNCGYSRC